MINHRDLDLCFNLPSHSAATASCEDCLNFWLSYWLQKRVLIFELCFYDRLGEDWLWLTFSNPPKSNHVETYCSRLVILQEFSVTTNFYKTLI